MGTNFNYDDTSHQVIFDHINGGAGSDTLQQNSQEWQQLGGDIGAAGKSYMQSAIRVILATRKGAAADAAAAATSAMLPWMDDVAQIAHAAAQRSQSQAEHWVTAKNSVPPVPPTPKPAGFASDPAEWAAEKMDWFPGVTSDEEKAQQRQQDAAEQARQAMRVYQSNSNGNVDPAPTFTAPQALDGSVGALPLSDPRVGNAGTPGMSGGGAPAHLLAAHQPPAHQPAAHQPAAQQSAAYQPAATVSQLARGGPGTGSVTPPPAQWAAEPAAGQGTAPGALPLGAGIAEGAAGRGRAVAARGPATQARGAGPGHAGFGPRPSTSFGPRPTPGAHPMEEISGARGGAGSTGATRAGGYGEPFAGGPAGASQRGEQDREHRTKYLIHTDSNAIVGDLPPTAPPVIGADY